jgi:hypothetical protein
MHLFNFKLLECAKRIMKSLEDLRRKLQTICTAQAAKARRASYIALSIRRISSILSPPIASFRPGNWSKATGSTPAV